MKIKVINILLLVFLSSSCRTAKENVYNYTNNGSFFIFKPQEKIPFDAVILSQNIKSKQNLFYDECGFENAMNDIKLKAVNIGGNAVRIIKYKATNGLGNGRFNITAEAIYIKDIDFAFQKKQVTENGVDSNCSQINIFRYKGAILDNFDLYLNDSIICRVKSNTNKRIKICKLGNYKITLKDRTDSILINISEFGNEYYIRAGMNIGVLSNSPTLNLLNNELGKLEYELFDFFD